MQNLAQVSIHAPPKGRDNTVQHPVPGIKSFNPRAPEGARPPGGNTSCAGCEFQSTRPRRGATYEVQGVYGQGIVSIHAPPKGRDAVSLGPSRLAACFNPRAPEGARRAIIPQPPPNLPVSIHAPPKGRDNIYPMNPYQLPSFNPRAPEGARRVTLPFTNGVPCFNPRAPEGARRWEERAGIDVTVFQSTRPRRGATGTSP